MPIRVPLCFLDASSEEPISPTLSSASDNCPNELWLDLRSAAVSEEDGVASGDCD